jgi:heme/copper-type cytochrome/quinol oxidase subunit 2
MTKSSIGVGVVTSVIAMVGISIAGAGVAAQTMTRVAQDDNHREITIAAKDGGFQPAKVEVRQNDLVKVTFTSEDGPHSLNVDAYRIAKRARPGRPAVFEFRADRAGTFPYYCNLSDPGSHDMKGELIVRER